MRPCTMRPVPGTPASPLPIPGGIPPGRPPRVSILRHLEDRNDPHGTLRLAKQARIVDAVPDDLTGLNDGDLLVVTSEGALYRVVKTNERAGADLLASLNVGAKADKVAGAAPGDLASLDSSGNLVDSGKKPADFASADAVAVLVGGDRGKSVRAVASEEAASAAQAIVGAGTPEAFDTLKEIADWIADDESGAAKLVSDVSGLQTGKADKVGGATSGNLAGLDSNGNLTDSGKKPADFAGAVHTHTASQITDLGGQLAPKAARTELFPAWAANTAYTTYSLVIHENAIYRCTTAHTSGAEWDSTKWAVATGADVLGVLLNYLALSNKPQINNITLTGESSQSGDSLGLVDKTGDQTIGGDKRFTGYSYFCDFTVSHPQGQGYVRIYASANENRVHIEFYDAVSGSQGELFLPILGGYGAVTLAAIENIAPDAFLMLYDGATVDLNTLYCYQGRLYRCILGYTFQSGDSYPPNDIIHWTPATVEDVLAALRTGKADVSAIPYALVTKTVSNGAVSLDDRASNSVTISSTLSPNTLTINFPTATSGKVRDFAMRLNIAAGVTAPEIAWPQSVTLENDGGEVPEIADGGTGGSSTILYFSETENDGTTAKFLVKGEALTAITQA